MFTGIIEEVGTVKEVQHAGNNSFIKVKAEKILEDVHIGDSIAVNGVCLTVTSYDNGIFRADVMNETLSRSSLGSLKNGSPVNLERAMSANGRFGGHIVSGHIDGTGIISAIKNDGIAIWYTINTVPEIMHYIIEKGSIAIDGISLTVAKVSKNNFSVSIIPHTAQQTILSYKKVGDIVNLENDIVGKYIEKFTRPEKNKNNISMNFLSENGFI